MSYEPEPEPERIEPTHAFLNLTILAAFLLIVGVGAGVYAVAASYSAE